MERGSSAEVWSALETSARGTAWTGVRNFEARNNLRTMKPGDWALYYHSGEGKEIVAVAKIVSPAQADPTAPNEDWAAVDVEPFLRLAEPVTLAQVKKLKTLQTFPLVSRSRLSVAPVAGEAFRQILSMGKTPWKG